MGATAQEEWLSRGVGVEAVQPALQERLCDRERRMRGDTRRPHPVLCWRLTSREGTSKNLSRPLAQEPAGRITPQIPMSGQRARDLQVFRLSFLLTCASCSHLAQRKWPDFLARPVPSLGSPSLASAPSYLHCGSISTCCERLFYASLSLPPAWRPRAPRGSACFTLYAPSGELPGVH